jgi:hypothetical protein
MNLSQRTRSRLILASCCLAAAVLFGVSAPDASAQVNPQEIVPPPLKILSRGELASLNAITDVKKRTQAALELMAVRLKQAELMIEQDNLDQMYKELGSFHGLMDNTLAYLDSSEKKTNRVLNNFKRLEMGLRQFRPRLEIIRRTIPSMYEPYVNNLIGYLRDTRAKAVEPLFSDTVVPRAKP